MASNSFWESSEESSTMPYSGTWDKESLSVRITRQINIYLIPVIICCGIIGNTLSFLVLQTKRFRRSPVGFVLSALAIIDSLIQLRTFFSLLRTYILKSVEVEFLTSRIICQLDVFFNLMLYQISPWSLVLLSVERVIVVANPVSGRNICTRKRIAIVWFIMLVTCQVLNGPVVLRVDIDNHDNCIQLHYGLWKLYDLVLVPLTMFIPFAVISVTNIVIFFNLTKSRRLRRQSSTNKGETVNSTTVMLFVTNATFLVLVCPMFVNYIYLYHPPNYHYNPYILGSIAQLALYLNSAINFLLYCVAGSQFRAALKELFKCS